MRVLRATAGIWRLDHPTSVLTIWDIPTSSIFKCVFLSTWDEPSWQEPVFGMLWSQAARRQKTSSLASETSDLSSHIQS